MPLYLPSQPEVPIREAAEGYLIITEVKTDTKDISFLFYQGKA